MEYTATFPTPLREIYTISRLNREARALLEGSFPPLWIEGEISNLARPASGHVYFCLKDATAQVRCALFRTQARQAAVPPKEGMHVLVRARLTLYEGRGEYQLVVDHIEEAGEGALRRAFEALKLRLAQEGLFDVARKRPLPRLPRRIGLITSPTGAVLHDIVTTLGRRFPAIPVLLYPVPVQGEGAAARIAEAIRVAGTRADCDVLILARGGGSLEDLWAFNEEVVARALAACPIPVVCGVGHETDVTIADLAADVRAPTPTAAAELVSPDQRAWEEQFRHFEQRLVRRMRDLLRERAQNVDWLTARLVHPRARLENLRHRLDSLTHRLVSAKSLQLHDVRATLHALSSRLERQSPLPRLRARQLHCRHYDERLRQALIRRMERSRERLTHLARALNTLSPLATLDRGYAIVRDATSGKILRDASTVEPGTTIEARLVKGALICRVEERREK
ncbi:MAG: exodeoxyribonuclease VII large subunit [Gammaproteobacteria bacterium]|nr:exodeoxyribonuclease VII large subunit [Gammaproteobacteria bacterium]